MRLEFKQDSTAVNTAPDSQVLVALDPCLIQFYRSELITQTLENFRAENRTIHFPAK